MSHGPATPIVRRHALRLLAERARHRVTLVVAPSGFGTSTLVRSFGCPSESIVVDVARGSSFARFASDVVEKVASRIPGLERSLAGAYARASQSGDPPRALAAWFCKQLVDLQCRITIDGLDRAQEDACASFVRHAISLGPDGTSWLLTMRDIERFPTASLLAFGHAALPIGERDLRVRAGELRELATSFGLALERDERAIVLRKSAGSISTASFLLAALARGVRSAVDPAVGVDDFIASELAEFDDDERIASIASTFIATEADAERIACLEAGPLAALAAVRARAPYLFAVGGARLHARVRVAFDGPIGRPSVHDRDRALLATAAAFERVGDLGGALVLLSRTRDEALLIAGIERHAAAALEGEHLHFMHDAIETLSDETRRSHPLVLSFLAMDASLGNRIDLAESLFQNALRQAHEPAHAHRIRYWYGTELIRRGRPAETIDLLIPVAAAASLPDRLRVAVMSTLAAAYATEGRLGRARVWSRRAIDGVGGFDDLALRARVYHQASFVALCAEDAPAARRLAEEAAACAESAGTAHVTTGAYSVLYAVAMDLEDDLADAARQLRRISVGAARANSVPMQLYALAASYELETERGDTAAIASLDRELVEFDLHYGASVESETILPARAMQQAWRGEFERAYRVLAGSEQQQFSDDRRALRAAEIALYAVAAGLTTEARRSIAYALERLPEGSVDLRASRARTTIALVFALLGHADRARAALAPSYRGATRGNARIAAYAEVVARVIDRCEGLAEGPEPLASALASLRANEWSGLCRVIETIPCALVATRADWHDEAAVG